MGRATGEVLSILRSRIDNGIQEHHLRAAFRAGCLPRPKEKIGSLFIWDDSEVEQAVEFFRGRRNPRHNL